MAKARHWTSSGAVLALGSLPWLLPELGVDLGSAQRGTEAHGHDATFGFAALVWASCVVAAIAVALSLLHLVLDRNFVVPALCLPLLCAAVLDTAFGLRLVSLPVDAESWASQGWVICRVAGALAWATAAAVVLRHRDQVGVGVLVASGAAALILCGVGLATMGMPELSVAGERPEAPLMIFALLGLMLLPKLARAHRGPLTRAVLLAVVPAIAAQLSMGIGSRRPFDHHFNAAFALLLTATVMPLAGVIGESFRAHRRRILEETLPHRVASAVAVAGSSDEAVTAMLDTVCEQLDWPVGHVWKVEDGTEPVVTSTGHWRLPPGRKLTAFRHATDELRCAPGVDLPGRILLWSKGAWVTDLREDPACPRAQAARGVNLAGAFGVPLGESNDVRFIAEFLSFHPERTDDRLLSLMERVGGEVGRALGAATRPAPDAPAAADAAPPTSGIVVSDALVAHMSHSLRTPLSSALGVTSLLLESPLDDQQIESVQTVRQSMDVLLHSVNEFVDFLRMEAGELELDGSDFALGDVLSDAVGAVSTTARLKGVDLELERDTSLPTHLHGDAPRVRQLVVSLLSHAIRSTHDGSLQLRAKLERRTETTVTMRVEVGGCARAARLAESWTADRPSSGADGGGLGLVVSRRLVQLMDGRTGFEPDGPEGGTLWWAVELTVAEDRDAGTTTAADNGHVLLVTADDDQDRIPGWLAEDGRRCTVSGDGDRALRTLVDAASGDAPFDVVLLDERVTCTDGTSLEDQIRTHPALRETVVARLGKAAGDGTVDASDVERFRASFDAARSPAAQAATAEPEPPRKPAEGPRGHILVVEDNAVNQAVARRLLERMGHQVDVASDGSEAVGAAKSNAYDLILMDYQMPVMDGYEATVAIRELPGDVSRTPIVAMTAKTMKGDREMCLAAGMDDYIAKPVSPKVLKEIVGHWLERVQARGPSRSEAGNDT